MVYNWRKMDLQNEKSKDVEEIIQRFSEFIKANIQTFHPQRSGIDINDIAQEVKLKLWKVLLSEKKITHLSSFIKRVVYSTTIDIMRKLKREKEILTNYHGSGIEENVSSDISCQEEIKQIIGQAIDSLIEPRRKVVRLYLLGMNLGETASFFNWTKDKVRNLLYRGLNDVKKILKEKGVDYENK